MDKFWHNFPEISKEFRIDIGQGSTKTLSRVVGGYEILIKDETKNQNGSFKDRGLSYQIARHLMEGHRKFAISSSGNAGVSASHIASKYNLELVIFVSENISKSKIDLINKYSQGKKTISVVKGLRPRSELVKFLRENTEFVSLRGSTDTYAPAGYETIAYELSEQSPEIDAIFIPTSSGTSAYGIYTGFQKLRKNVQIHICQTEKVNAIAKQFDTNFQIQNTSLSDAITDKVAHRKSKLIEIIKSSRGFGWVLSDVELLTSKKLLSEAGVGEYSFNSILAFSGFQKAVRSGYNFTNPVMLFSGL